MSQPFDDTDLRDLLDARAADAPAPDGLLPAVHRRSRLRRARRLSGTVGVMAVVGLVGGLVVTQPGGGARTGPDAAASASEEWYPGPAWTIPPEKHPLLLTEFPYRPTWNPKDFHAMYGAVINEGTQQLGYLDTAGPPTRGRPTIVLDLHEARPREWPADGENVTVRGGAALFATASEKNGEDVLAWEEDGRFLVLRTREFSREDVFAFAEGLRDGGGPAFLASGCGDPGIVTFFPEPGSTYSSLSHDGFDGPTNWTSIEYPGYAARLAGTETRTVDVNGVEAVIGTDPDTGDRILVMPDGLGRDLVTHGGADYLVTDDQRVYEALDYNLSGYPC
ncbi:MAG TPA: hypothetical protein VGF17_12100 [Phytomonospora sp.]